MVAHRGDEDLGLMFQTPEGIAVENAIAVALKFQAERAGWLRPLPAT
jgi:hypothetical protein